MAIAHIVVFCLKDIAIVFAENPGISEVNIEDNESEEKLSAKSSLMTLANSSSSEGSAINDTPSNFNTNALQNLQPSLFTSALTYSIPISVPVGRNGVQPNIALTYSSQSGNGILGMGWFLELGCIERSTKNGVPIYNNSQDTFIFKAGGSTTELVNIGGNEYRAKIEGSFMKFTLSDNSWLVKDKIGTTYYFGQTQDSQQVANSRIFKWCLDRVEDVLGNYMTLTYIKDANQVYPDTINYTGYAGDQSLIPAFQVDFDYSDSIREDYFFTYRSNFLIRTNKLLREITVRQSGSRIRKYSLSYEYSHSTKRALLTSVAQYGLTDDSLLPAIGFSYQEKPFTFSGVISWNNIHNFGNNEWVGTRSSSGEQTYVDIFDINRDGLPDRIFRGYNNTDYNRLWVQLNNGTSFDNLQAWSYIAAQPGQNERASIRYGSGSWLTDTLDINGDSLPDRIYRRYNGNYNQWEVQLNNGNGFDNSIAWTNIAGFNNPSEYTDIRELNSGYVYIDLFDMNGDGLSDRVIRSLNTLDRWYVQLNNRNNAFDDPLAWFNLQYDTHSSESYIRNGSHNLYFATLDINGDGLPDRLMDNNNSNDVWAVQFNNGSSFENILTWGQLQNRYEPQWSYMGYYDPGRVTTVDMNGDGLLDRVTVNTSSQHSPWKVQINNGHGFEPVAVWGPIIDSGDSSRSYILYGSGPTRVDLFDINGDGLPDRVMRGYSNYDHWDVQLNNGPIPDLLASISNGLGGVATVTYDTYIGYDNTEQADKGNLGFPVNVVVEIKVSDGRGNSYATQYSYDRGKFDCGEREFRGFGKVVVIEAEGNHVINYFHQDGYKKGRLYRQETFDNSDKLYAVIENIWGIQKDIYQGHPDIKFVYLSQNNTYTYEGDNSARRIKTEYFYQESPQYGNLTQVIEYGEVNTEDGSDIGEDKRVTHTYYAHNNNKWIVSLPYRVVVNDINENINSEKMFYYDEQNNIGESPIKGLPTQEKIWLYNYITAQEQWLSNRYTYDVYGNLTSATDANNHTASTSYDDVYHIYPLTVTNALGHIANSAYYGINGVLLNDNNGFKGMFGQLKYMQDPNGIISYNTYDDLGRLEKRVGPNDNIDYPAVIYEYDLNIVNSITNPVKVTKRIKAVNHPSSFNYPDYYSFYSFYDGMGRLIETKSQAEPNPGSGILRQIISGITLYNNRGLVYKKYLPYFMDADTNFVPPDYNQPYFSFQYDCLGRAVQTTNPDNTQSSSAFDDWLVTITDENNHTKTYYYDAFQRLIRIDEHNNTETYATAYAYDVLGNLTSITDSQHNTTAIIYDSLGRKIRMNDPDMGIWNYEYDNIGNLIRQIDAAQQQLTFTYDALNRLTQKTIQNDQTVTYEYDNVDKDYCLGRLSRVTYQSGSAEFLYDKLGREIKSIKRVDGEDYTVERAYDSLNRLIALSYPDGEIITYTYNPQGIETVVSSEDRTYISNINYSPTSQIIKIKYGNSTTTDYTYNPQTLRLTRLVTNSPQVPIQDLDYVFDKVGNITAITDNTNNASQMFEYDGLNRLAYANGTYYGQSEYSYNSIGNILTRGSLILNYQDIRPHAASSMTNGDGTVGFTYDSNGNLSHRINQQSKEQSNYYYDFESRLNRVEQIYPAGSEIKTSLELQPGWNFFSIPLIPTSPQITEIFSGLEISRDYDQVSRYDPQTDTFQHFVGDPDFNEFETLEYNRGYVIYVNNPNGLKVAIGGITPEPLDIPLLEGWNLMPYPYLSQRSIQKALGNLRLGVDYDKILNYNNSTGRFEQYPGSLSELEPTKSYYIHCLRNTVWDIQPLSRITEFFYDGDGGRVKIVSGIDRGQITVYIGSLFEKLTTDEGLLKIKKHIFAGPNRVCSIELTNQEVDQLYYHPDHLGSSNMITDENGNYISRYEYKPFGEVAYEAGSPITDIKYTGKIQDDTGLYYYGARHYDPSIGRFVSPDIIVQAPQDPQTLNRYAYCRNNPIKYVDPTGHWFFAAIAAMAKAASAYMAAHPIISGAAMGGLLGGVDAGIDGYNVFQGIGVGALGGMVGGAVGLGTGDFLDGAIGNFWAGMSGAGLGGTAAGVATTAVTRGNIGLGALAGLTGGVAGFIGGYNFAPSVGHISGNVASAAVADQDLGGAALGGFIDASIITTLGLVVSESTIGDQGTPQGGDLIFYKGGFDISGLFLSYLQGAPISHIAIAINSAEQVDSHIKGGVNIHKIRFSSQGHVTKWAGSGSQRFIALAVQYGRDNAFQYWLGPKREICSTFVSRTAKETGLSVPGFSPSSQYYNIEGIPYHNFYRTKEQ